MRAAQRFHRGGKNEAALLRRKTPRRILDLVPGPMMHGMPQERDVWGSAARARLAPPAHRLAALEPRYGRTRLGWDASPVGDGQCTRGSRIVIGLLSASFRPHSWCAGCVLSRVPPQEDASDVLPGAFRLLSQSLLLASAALGCWSCRLATACATGSLRSRS